MRRASRGRRERPSSVVLVGCGSEGCAVDVVVAGAGVLLCAACGGFEALFWADSVAGEAMLCG